MKEIVKYLMRKYKKRQVYDARTLARYMINYAISNGKFITNLSLQKYLFYLQLFHYSLYDTPFFYNDIEAWGFGPVVPDVYNEYRIHGSMLLLKIDTYRDRDKDSPNYLKRVKFNDVIINKEDKEDINLFLDLFLNYSARFLTESSKKEKPFLENYIPYKSTTIPKYEIKEYSKKCFQVQEWKRFRHISWYTEGKIEKRNENCMSKKMDKKKEYSAEIIAIHIINYANKTGKSCSNLKLQKLLYYLQMYFFSKTNKLLFKEDIEAWGIGPIIPVVYEKYKIFGTMSISKITSYVDLDYDSDTFMKKVDVTGGEILWNDQVIINEFLDCYLNYNSAYLLSESQKSDPWLDYYVEDKKEIIPKKELKVYARKVWN